MWLVLVKEKNRYKVHSSHCDEKDARSWSACLQDDNSGGHDTAIAYIDDDAIESINAPYQSPKEGNR